MPEIYVDAKPAEVFDYIADLLRHTEWASHPLTLKQTSTGPIQVGSTYKSVGHQFGQDIEDSVTVTEYIPGSRFAFESDGKGGRLRHAMTVRPSGDGAILSKDTRPLRLSTMARIMFPLLLIQGPRLLKRDLANIKSRLEQQRASAQKDHSLG